MIVWGCLVADQLLVTRDGTYTVNCTTGIDAMGIMARLQYQLHSFSNVHYTDGMDSTRIIGEIANSFSIATADINALPKDPADVLDVSLLSPAHVQTDFLGSGTS
ncbi:hypothetical protein RSOLAG22IIIB_10364 [Rhizoctonia solani]|uniref:Uncharacterized protein n=1 Tax=Rhizoctonia solani TaxID=456999 RepID=A0A0K6G3D5_9AGAM|nr:hypothetical protein RSOLAG22IIIB_10364 [Rhizoctonia solani]